MWCVVNFDVGTTLFHFRLLCAAHTFGTVVIAVTVGRPVVASSLCKSQDVNLFVRVLQSVRDAIIGFGVCFQFSNLHGS